MRDMPGMIRIPMRAVPKARPRVTKRGTFMPKEYVQWKKDFGKVLAVLRVPADSYEGNLALEIIFDTDEMWVQLVPINDVKPKHLRRIDIDNAIGAVMDAFQEANVIADDKQIVQLDVSYKQGEHK